MKSKLIADIFKQPVNGWQFCKFYCSFDLALASALCISSGFMAGYDFKVLAVLSAHLYLFSILVY